MFLLKLLLCSFVAVNAGPATESYKDQFCTDPRTMKTHAAYTEWADPYSCTRHRCQPGDRNLAIYTVGCKRVEPPESAIECEEFVEDTNMQFPYCCTRLTCLVVVRGEVWKRVLGQPWETLPAAPLSHMYKTKKPPPPDDTFLAKNAGEGPIYELAEAPVENNGGRDKVLRSGEKAASANSDCNDTTPAPPQTPDIVKPNMSKRTVLNENYKGLVENFAIPAELHEVGGKKYATFGGVVPIHCCSPEQVSERAATTHHYCDIFTDDVLAPLAELAYVRLDESHAEKVFINRTKRLLVVSSDGRLAQWRSAPTFESANRYVAGAPVVDQRGALVSLVTARRGNHYAVSNIEGEGGYFETPNPWTVVEVTSPAELIYGDRTFATRDELRRHVEALPAPEVSGAAPTRAVLFRGRQLRLALVTSGGRQLAHHYLQGVQANDVEYL